MKASRKLANHNFRVTIKDGGRINGVTAPMVFSPKKRSDKIHIKQTQTQQSNEDKANKEQNEDTSPPKPSARKLRCILTSS